MQEKEKSEMETKNKIIENIDILLNEYMGKNNIPGLALGVVYDNEVIYTKGFGVKNIDTKEAISEYSLFHMDQALPYVQM